MENLIKELQSSLQTSFIDYKEQSLEEYRTKLLINNHKQGTKVSATLISELETCEEFYFSVAFINSSGLAVIINTLKELEKRNIRGKIITTNYLDFSEPKALRKLLEFSNIELKLYDGSLHTKGYIFKKKNEYNMIVGSSNLTSSAISSNQEWNLKVTSSQDGQLLKDVTTEFNRLFDICIPITNEWLDEYEIKYKEKKKREKLAKQIDISQPLTPNKMQLEAMQSLEDIRNKGLDKALVISATATGKTYLSAFDVQKYNPKRMLFIVHREQIAKKSMESYQKVFKNTKLMGVLSGTHKDLDCEYVFATMQTLSKDNILESFTKEHFDYIVIDEVHRAGAKTYLKILNYFKPKFLMGMTATPERTDNFNIYELFDYNIAYEIRLQRALEEDMLCPFHYYGVSEISVDGIVLDDKASFNYLTCEEGINNIISNAKFYGYSGDRVKGLVFCSRNEEAKQLSNEFNKRGYNTISLSGANTQEERENALVRLEQDELDNKLDYIFTVDIFNEGVDIPKVNQIIMLRATESAIVFVQQLGRGLRKSNNKDYVIVIDFIGNYETNFLIPIALFGDSSGNKDNIRKIVTEGNNIIPGNSTIIFDEVVKKRIYDSINKTNFSTLKNLRDCYYTLKNKIGRIPTLLDFYNYGSIDVSLILNYARSYYNFLTKNIKEIDDTLNLEQKAILEFMSMELSSAKRIHELIILKQLFDNGKTSIDEISNILKEYNIQNDNEGIVSALSLLNSGFLTSSAVKKYRNCNFIKYDGNNLLLSDYIVNNKNDLLLDFIYDIINYGIKKYSNNYTNRYHNKNLTLYQKYSRKDVCKLLNWTNDESSTLYGYKIKHNTCPLFVTYNKRDDISKSTKYNDKFINKQTFSWLTKANRRVDSIDVNQIMNHEENNLNIELFIKKADGEGTDFYYLGSVKPIHFIQKTTIDDNNKELPIYKC